MIGHEGNGQARDELEWHLEAVPTADPITWPAALLQSLEEAADTTDDGTDVPEARRVVSYAELVERVNQRGQRPRSTGVSRTDFARSAAARRVVLIRCAGRCESPHYTGMPAELNRQGEPILTSTTSGTSASAIRTIRRTWSPSAPTAMPARPVDSRPADGVRS